MGPVPEQLQGGLGVRFGALEAQLGQPQIAHLAGPVEAENRALVPYHTVDHAQRPLRSPAWIASPC